MTVVRALLVSALVHVVVVLLDEAAPHFAPSFTAAAVVVFPVMVVDTVAGEVPAPVVVVSVSWVNAWQAPLKLSLNSCLPACR
jgi:hypothetical protein